MSDFDATPVPEKTNGLAIASAVCGLLSIIGVTFFGLGSGAFALVPIVMSVIASRQITRSNDTEKGKIWATIGLILPILALLGLCVSGGYSLMGPQIEEILKEITTG